MKIPTMDLTGKVTFPEDKPKDWSAREHEALNTPIDYWKEDDDVGDNAGTTDNHDSHADLEAEQTADMHELRQRQQVSELFHDLLNTLRRRAIPPRIWFDELENHLSVYDFWKEV
jgi:hypothetical protein